MSKGIELTVKTIVVVIIVVVTTLFILRFLQVGFPAVVEPAVNISEKTNESMKMLDITQLFEKAAEGY